MFRLSPRLLSVPFCLVLLGLAPAARAAVVPIDQATSVNGLPGCPHTGFPILICQSGSYRLAGNLTTTSVDIDVIDITANDVTLDLNGFSIIGPVTCQQGTYPVVCSSAGGFGTAIQTPSLTPVDNVTVRNGNIRGMGGAGITLYGYGSIVDGLHVDSTGPGILNFSGHPFPSIYVLSGVVSHCAATTNAGSGFGGASTTVEFSSSSYNGGYGFWGLVGNLGPPNSFFGAFVVNNSVASNNGQDGIFDAFLAANNTSTYNVGLGLRYDGNGYGYIDNVIYGNKGGTVTLLGTSLGHNLCNSVAC